MGTSVAPSSEHDSVLSLRCRVGVLSWKEKREVIHATKIGSTQAVANYSVRVGCDQARAEEVLMR